MNQPSPRLRAFAPLCWATVVLLALSGCPGGLNVTGTNPAADATGVSTNAAVSITFSAPLDASTVTAARFQLTAGSSQVAGTVATNGSSATFTSSAPLAANTQYRMRVQEGIKGTNGSQLGSAHEWTFTTGAAVGPTFFVSATNPANGASNVSPAAITFTLSAPVDPATVSGTTVLADSDGTPVAGTVSAATDTVTFTPTSALEIQRMYRIQLSGVRSAAGDTLAPYTLTFATSTGVATGISGRVTYDWVPAASGDEGGNRLDYSGIQARPARRIRVEAVVNGGAPLVTTTNDHGFYSFPAIASGASVQVRALARLDAVGYARDGRGPEACEGANWEIDVVDNTAGQARWMLADSATRTAPFSDANLHAATAHSGTAYTARAGAPFAIADTFVEALEKICQGNPAFTLPHLNANWSPDNVPMSGDPATGRIGTSHYRHPASGPNLYILGAENEDTDEYDDHVVAHEFAHFLEDTLYRSDSVGGRHQSGDVLDPRVAFGEGYGNAFSAITFQDPIYVDTFQQRQTNGFEISVLRAPVGNDRGVYSEFSVQHLLWMLFENRDGTATSGSFDRIHAILRDFQRGTPALTTAQSFAAYYNQQYGDADGLLGLWETTLAGDYDSLCPGTCDGVGDAADPFDLDNDLGAVYAPSRTYAGSSRGAEFWRLYKTLSGAGFAAPGDAHDVTVGATTEHNRFGAQRWYRYVGTGAAKNAAIKLQNTATCSTDVLDVDLFQAGFLSSNNDTSGCPVISIPGSSGVSYVLSVYGFPGGQDVNGFGVELQ
ncbi:MAG: Ig-like domain-containing protein [Myxococcota bacterium]|nr:Ig-like domain-containing protein [Myxococcota bacterium]